MFYTCPYSFVIASRPPANQQIMYRAYGYLGCRGYPQKDVILQDSDPPEAAGHSNWYMFPQTNISFQDSDPPDAAGHRSTWL